MGDVVDFRTVTMGSWVPPTGHGSKKEGLSGKLAMERLTNLEHARGVLFDIVRRKSVEGIEIEKALKEVSEAIELKYLITN